MKFCRRIFNRVKPAPKPSTPPNEINWGHVVAHEKSKQGANSWSMEYSEYTYGNILSHSLNMPSATRDNGGVYGAAKELINKDCNATIECHYNAFNGSANGCEILVLKGDTTSEIYANKIVEEFSKMYPERRIRADDGIKWISKGDRGYYNLVNAKSAGAKIAILTELFFGDNEHDFITPARQAMIINKAVS